MFWYFTFGVAHFHANTFVKLEGTCDTTRQRMTELFGNGWSMQYSERQWNDTSRHGVPMAQHYGWTELSCFLPCPFCQSSRIHGHPASLPVVARCFTCDSESPLSKWNKREGHLPNCPFCNGPPEPTVHGIDQEYTQCGKCNANARYHFWPGLHCPKCGTPYTQVDDGVICPTCATTHTC